MNIKGLSTIQTSVATTGKVERVDRSMSMENTQDRDANGQQFYDEQKKKEKMTDEQFEKAIELMREKDFIKDMGWVVTPIVDGPMRYACVQDQSGVVVRKISEFDLWDFFHQTNVEPSKGQLLKVSA